MCQFGIAKACQIGAADGNLSLIEGDIAGNTVEKGGLPRAGRPHDGHEFPLFHTEIDTV